MLFPEQPTIPQRFSEIYLFCKPCHLNKLLQKCWPQSSAGLGKELKDTGYPTHSSGLQLTMVTGMFLIQLEMKQLLLQHQFLFNSKPIKGLTYLINKKFQQMTKKRQKKG